MTRRLVGVLVVGLLVSLPAVASATGRIDMPATDTMVVGAPPPGFGLAVTAVTTDGRSLDLAVASDATGVQGMLDHASATSSSQDGIAAVKGPCQDSAHHEIGFRWTQPWAWWFRASSTPTGLSKTAAETQLRSAVRSITGARNDCGRPDRVSAQARYQGRTARKPAVRASGVCAQPDGYNVVGFGTLPFGIAALTCTWYHIASHGWGRAIESDVLLNKRSYHWAVRPRSCTSGELILRAVATHEFGHVFGLAHVSETSHPSLTMSTYIAPCDDSPFSLGKGDLLGLERLY
jgi:hypothetical protein